MKLHISHSLGVNNTLRNQSCKITQARFYMIVDPCDILWLKKNTFNLLLCGIHKDTESDFEFTKRAKNWK